MAAEMLATKPPKPAIKWHGGKFYLADWIIGLMPPHLHYVEPFAGGLQVLLRKNPINPSLAVGSKAHEQGCSEVVNDLHGGLTNFWRVIRDGDAFAEFQRRVALTPFSESEFDSAERLQFPSSELAVTAAVAFFIRARQSRQGLMKDFATLSRTRTRSRMNEQVSSWLGAVDGLADVHRRLQPVVILNRDGIDVIRSQDGPHTLFYCDPPYVHDSRTAKDAYAHEMSTDDHRRLLDVLRACQGKVLLSGYANGLYDTELADWNRHDRSIDNKASSAAVKAQKIESVWCNF